MKSSSVNPQDKALLLKTARGVYSRLKTRVEGTGIRLKWPLNSEPADSNGWKATIGYLGTNSPQLQIWLDFQSAYSERKLWFGFRATDPKKINHLIGSVARKFLVRRTITIKDLNLSKHYQLKKRLPQNEFNVPIFENYWGHYLYFGMFDLSPLPKGQSPNIQFCKRAADFFESVAGAAQTSKHEDYARTLRKVLTNRPKFNQAIPLPTPVKSVQTRKILTNPSLDNDSVWEMSGDDFAEQIRNRRELGESAQRVALKAERRRLREAGRSDLARRTKDVSTKPALGYDLRSFELDGSPRHIEVKAANKSGQHVSFYLTENERVKSRRLTNYYVYLVFGCRQARPEVVYLRGNQLHPDSLTPITYAARLKLD